MSHNGPVDGVRILSFDGGGLNCLSQLRILGEFMHRLQHDTGEILRPCEYFHSITGVGASGVIAILLGVLGLSVDDASSHFLSFCKKVSLDEEIDPELRSTRLVAATKELLHGMGISEECKLREDLALSFGKGCRVSVLYLSAADMTHCRMLRSYDSRHFSHNPTLVEAISIAWAVPGLFGPVRIGEALTREQVVGVVDGFNNPTLQAVNEAHEVFGGDQRVSCLLSLGGGIESIRSLDTDSQELSRWATRDTDIGAEQLKGRYSGLRVYFRLSVDRNLGSGISSMPIDDSTWRINAYTSIYLESHDASEVLDSCLRSSRQASYVTMDDLCRTRVNRARSSHGLPPLSAFFVTRKKPLAEIAAALRRHTPGSPAVALVIGLSGTGKTQISLKYAYEHGHEYDHIFFVDASSTESIEKGLITRLRAVDRQLSPADAEEALDLLANPQGNLTRNWLIIMDNADDINVDLRDFIPSCDHGAILLTSRNTALVDLYPDGHIAMGTMSQEEAAEALLSAVFGSGARVGPKDSPAHSTQPNKDFQCATKLVEELGCLPLAVIQAACYIKKHKCLHEYSQLLSTSRTKILRWPASVQRDKLRYAHSTYAAFDTNISALSPRALQLLGLFSCFHFTDFPRPLIALAASLGFKSQPHDLLDQPTQYQQSINFLNGLFCPDGHWDQTEFDALIEELQTYSLVTIVSAYSMITLRFHPLLHGWANDRLAPLERSLFRTAAARVLVCATNEDDDYLWPHLSPHVERFISTDDAHVNDLAALVAILKQDGHAYKVRNVLEEVYATVESVYGEKHIRTTRAALQLADAVGLQGDWDRMESLIRSVVGIRKRTLGPDHLETADAVAALARACELREHYEESANLGLDVLKVRRAKQGSRHRDVAKALTCLSETFILQENYAGACTLLNEALEIMIGLVGRSHVATVRIMERLSQCHKHSWDVERYIRLEREIIDLWRNIRGSMHAKTFDVMTKLATFYLDQGQHGLAETLLRELESGRREMLGKEHEATLDALYCLSKAIIEQERHVEAEVLLKQVLAGRRETLGDKHKSTLEAKDALAYTIYAQGRLDEAKVAFRELSEMRKELAGEHDADTLDTLRQLACVLDDQGQHKEAETVWRNVLEGLREILGDQHEDTIAAFGRLADSINKQDRFEEVGFLRTKMQLANRVRLGEPQVPPSSPLENDQTVSPPPEDERAISRAPRGVPSEIPDLPAHYDDLFPRRASESTEQDSHEDVLDEQFQAGRSAYEQEVYAVAEALWKQVVSGREIALGKKHASTLTALRWLAVSLYKQQRHADAEQLWRDLLLRLRETTGEQHKDVLSALDWLARSVYKQERYAEAAAIWREAIAGMQRKRGNQHGDTLRALFWLGSCLYEQGQYTESETVWKSVVAGRQLNLGRQHEDTLDALSWQASALHAQGQYSYAEVLRMEILAWKRKAFGPKHPNALKAKRLLAETREAMTANGHKDQALPRRLDMGKVVGMFSKFAK